MNIFKRFSKPKPPSNKKKVKTPPPVHEEVAIPPGRVSKPDDFERLYFLKEDIKIVKPSFRADLIPLLRALYKINPDVGIAIQDMFKLSNTGHIINFPNDTSEVAQKLRIFLNERSKHWSTYTAGINGLINKFIVQCYITGAISIEAVPNKDLSGISTIILVKPETILFQRTLDGRYTPYQQVTNSLISKNNLNKLNEATYTYVSIFNDLDEPYGIPPFLMALDSLDGQAIMKLNFKKLMEQAGMLGFMEATIEKSPKKASESESTYINRLERDLTTFKRRIQDGLADGVIVGHNEDHQFKFNSTTKDMANVDKFWNMNQQSVANGLGISGNIIGIQTSTSTEGSAGINLSKLISQLRNIQMLVAYVLERIYTLELRLAGLSHKGISVTFGATTISDELKVQQGQEIKIRNLVALYQQGIISQEDFAWEMRYNKPHLKEPILNPMDDIGNTKDKADREKDKDKSDRKKRDTDKPQPKRKDQDTKPRT